MSKMDSVTNAFSNELPNDWNLLPIKHGFRLTGSGTTPPSGDEKYYGDYFPWVTTSELREKIITATEKSVSEIAIKEFSALKIYPPNSVLVAMYGATIGRVGILGISACVNQAVCVLANPTRFEHRFVSYSLQAARNYLLGLASGGGQPNLNAEKLVNIKLPCPDIRVQQVVADYLDRETAKIDALIRAKEHLVELLIEKRHAVITDAVTHGANPNVIFRASEVKWIGDIPIHWDVEYARWLFIEIDERSTEHGEEELLSVSHLTGVTARADKEVNMFLADSNEGYKICRQGDLVINTLWAWMGAMGIAFQDGIVSPAYNVYRLREKYIPEYIDILARIPIFAQEVTRFSRGVWSSRLRLYPEEFFKVQMPVPPLSEQREIVEYVKSQTEKIDRLFELAQKTIEHLHERRASLIAAVVSGQIKVE